MASLYTISNELQEIFSSIEENSGEITDEISERLACKENELQDKLTLYIQAIKEWQNSADFCKKEKQSINDRQNIYKNRIERLKSIVLDTIDKFGEESKTNKFIELPQYRLSTRNSSSLQINEDRLNLLSAKLIEYFNEIVNAGILFINDEVDIEGILCSINANCKAECGDNFIPFTLDDINNIKFNITISSNPENLFKKYRHVINSMILDPVNIQINTEKSKDYWKEKLITNSDSTLTDNIITKSLIIK